VGARIVTAGVCALVVAAGSTADAREPATPADAWLDALLDRAAADLKAGRPLVVHAHVALCDNSIIRCGSRGLGDGDSLRTNLYWASGGGARGFFDRRASGWTRVFVGRAEHADVLERVVWRRRVAPGAAWRQRGVGAPIEVYVVVDAWRGRAIDAAVAAYLGDLYGEAARVVRLGANGSGGGAAAALRAGGAAHLVAYLGHNRWMDTPDFDWAAFARRARPRQPKGTIAIACHTRAYLRGHVPAPTRVPLLLTADFLFASAPAFESAVVAFAGGGSLRDIRAAATRGYAQGQRRPLHRVGGVFTNPSDRRWDRR
jgi:hypothetical protein